MESRWCKALGSSIGWHELLVGKFQDCPCIIRNGNFHSQPASHRKVTNPTNRIPHPIPHQPSPRFHYTTKGNFNAICSSAYLTPELYSALKDADGSVFGWCFFLRRMVYDLWEIMPWIFLGYGKIDDVWFLWEGAANIQPEDANESAICLFRLIFQITSTSWWVDILGHAGSGLWGCLK